MHNRSLQHAKYLQWAASLALTLSIVLTPVRHTFALTCADLFGLSPDKEILDKNQNNFLNIGSDYRLEIFDIISANPVFKVFVRRTHQLIGVFKLPEKPKPISPLRRFIFLRGKAQIEEGGLAARSVFAYRLSQLLGLGQVPLTMKASSIEYGFGSYIDFLHDYKNAYEIYRDAPDRFKMITASEAQKFLLFDLLVQAQDRSTFNWMMNEQGKMGLIDNDRILLNTDRPDWFVRVNLKTLIPQAMGPLLPEAVAMIKALSDESFSSLLYEYDFPEKVVLLARKRLQLLKDQIGLNPTMEEIYQKTPPGYICIRFLGNELLLRYN